MDSVQKYQKLDAALFLIEACSLRGISTHRWDSFAQWHNASFVVTIGIHLRVT